MSYLALTIFAALSLAAALFLLALARWWSPPPAEGGPAGDKINALTGLKFEAQLPLLKDTDVDFEVEEKIEVVEQRFEVIVEEFEAFQEQFIQEFKEFIPEEEIQAYIEEAPEELIQEFQENVIEELEKKEKLFIFIAPILELSNLLNSLSYFNISFSIF